MPSPKKKLQISPKPAAGCELTDAAVGVPNVFDAATLLAAADGTTSGSGSRSSLGRSSGVADGVARLPPRIPSRRSNPNAAQANGPSEPEPSDPPEAPPPSHDTRPVPNPDTSDAEAATVGGAATATGRSPTASSETDTTAPFSVVGTAGTTAGLPGRPLGRFGATGAAAGWTPDAPVCPEPWWLADGDAGEAAARCFDPLTGPEFVDAAVSFGPCDLVPDDAVGFGGESEPAGDGAVRGVGVAFDCAPGRAFGPGAPPEGEPGEFEALDPAVPDVSANATRGIEATAAPTPSATASAPTRPT